MKRPALALAVGLLAVAAVAGVARAALEQGPQSLEARTQAVASTLRCPTCDNLSVADSPEAMAQSMRAEITDQLDQGRSPDQIRQWFHDRYGPWILLNPPGEGIGTVVWLMPVAALVVAAAIGAWLLRGRRSRRTPDVGTGDLLWRWQHDDLSLPESPEGERVEAALSWLDETERNATANPQARIVAEHELATAWEALHTPDQHDNRGRALGWGTGALVLVVAVAAALPTAIATRGIGEVATGTIPADTSPPAGDDGAAAGPSRETAPTAPEATTPELLAELQQAAAAEANPQEAATAVEDRLPAAFSPEQRLNIALASLQQQHLAAAEALATSVLADRPEHLEATLLRGLALTARGDDAGPRWLRHFTDAAPSDHPGQPLAKAALRDSGRTR